MHIFSDIGDYAAYLASSGSKGTAAAVGKFDGLHRGHRKLLETVLKSARERGLKTAVFSFDKSIASFFSGEEQKVLTTLKERRELLRDLSFDALIEFPVNEKTVAIEPEDFIKDILCGGLKIRELVAGPDMSYGYMGRGDFELLKKMGKKYCYEAIAVPKLLYEGEEISSTRVRTSVLTGDMELAEALLGRPYSIEGYVRHGRALGKSMLSMPTVNLEIEDNKILPPLGVYFSRAIVGSEVYNGITNIGRKPTIAESGRVNAETYLYDFDGDLYGAFIRVGLLHWHREEMRFPDLDSLKRQMHEDMLSGRGFFEGVSGHGG